MSEMVERVAKAIGNVLVCDSTGECLLIATDKQCTDMARAAIEAMREPTNGMVDAVGLCWGPTLESNWQRMIDAALDPFRG